MTFTKTNLNETLWVHPHTLAGDRKWWIVDASGKTLGKLAVEIARKLSGKDKVHYCTQWDCGDYVVVINTARIVTSGNKMTDKVYYKHTGWKGHLKEITLEKLLQKDANQVIHLAVKGMLPKNKLRKPRLKRLKLSTTGDHAYTGETLLPWSGRTMQQKSGMQQQQQQQ
jgi:large subunit ribosomal protein L13